MEARALPRTTFWWDASLAKYARHQGLKRWMQREGESPALNDVNESLSSRAINQGVTKQFHGPLMHEMMIMMII